MPNVSVIIPVYNDGKYLNDAIQSVFRQRYPDWEIVIVDDGSKDAGTHQVLKQINHPRIRVFFQKHKGVSAARNFAAKKATGKYLLPLDADDLLGRAFLEQAVKILESRQETKVVCGQIEMFGTRSGRKELPAFSMEMLLGQNTMAVTSLFRKSDFLQTRGFNENMQAGFEDWDFWLTLLEPGGEVQQLKEIAVYYRVKKKSRNISLSSQQMQNLRRQIYENHKKLYSTYFFDPLKSFEYDLLRHSKEYQLGKLLLQPVRFLKEKFL